MVSSKDTFYYNDILITRDYTINHKAHISIALLLYKTWKDKKYSSKVLCSQKFVATTESNYKVQILHKLILYKIAQNSFLIAQNSNCALNYLREY